MRAAAVIIGILFSGSVVAQSFICAADLDGDGDSDQATEQAVCFQSQTGERVCPLQAQQCAPNVLGLDECPIDPTLPCVVSSAGTSMCSANVCQDPATIPREVIDPPGGGVSDDGPRDAEGNCLGQLVVFPGKALRCRTAGTQTLFHNCCTDAGSMDDTMGSEDEQSQSEELQSNVDPLYQVITNSCDGEDNEASFLLQSNYCYELGEYCAEDWAIGGCVQRARMQCCFNSRLAKIIHEQGRPQLTTFTEGFGTVEEPNCRGFTMEEFQSLDFSKIDLTEYTDELRTRNQQLIEEDMRENAEQRLGGG